MPRPFRHPVLVPGHRLNLVLREQAARRFAALADARTFARLPDPAHWPDIIAPSGDLSEEETAAADRLLTADLIDEQRQARAARHPAPAPVPGQLPLVLK